MDNIDELENYYKKFTDNAASYLPDGFIDVDLPLLQKFDLLHYHQQEPLDQGLTRYFNVIESPEKITLVNEKYVIWLVPEKKQDQRARTFAFIALNQENSLHLEAGFVSSGIYNTSRLVLRVLEIFLQEIEENEDLINRLIKT